MLEDDIRRIVEEVVKEQVAVHQDSMTVDTPSKGGELKVYFNASNLGETKMRIDNALEAREYLKGRAAGTTKKYEVPTCCGDVSAQKPICDTCELDGHCEIKMNKGVQYNDCSIYQDKKR